MKPLAEHLIKHFGNKLQQNVPLHRFTTARTGGIAAGLIIVESLEELTNSIRILNTEGFPYKLIGEGSNILVSDAGFEGLILINHSHQVSFDLTSTIPLVTADSGVNLATLSRKIADQSLSGFEWACGIPGTLGGAIYGNAGAHGKDMQNSLESASILHPDGSLETWHCQQFEYEYRSSVLKRCADRSIILNANLRMERKEKETITSLMAEFTARRKATQPSGASLGSIFKNPPGDYAGRLIESAGLKGYRIGGVAVSEKHANFFVNDLQGNSADVYLLIRYVQSEVERRFGQKLETEIELLGTFSSENNYGKQN